MASKGPASRERPVGNRILDAGPTTILTGSDELRMKPSHLAYADMSAWLTMCQWHPVQPKVSWLRLYLASHRCRRGSTTSRRATGQAMLTALRRSRLAFWYSSSSATRTIISPLSEVRGPVAATKPLLWDPSSISSCTRCPGSGTSGGCLLLKTWPLAVPNFHVVTAQL
jgi:hypothetical protein